MDCVLKIKLQGTDFTKFVEMCHVNIKVAIVILIILYLLMNSNAMILQWVNKSLSQLIIITNYWIFRKEILLVSCHLRNIYAVIVRKNLYTFRHVQVIKILT